MSHLHREFLLQLAFVHDTPEGGLATVQLLEYVNSQLLEFRHYDELLTRELGSVYRALEKKAGLIAGFSLAGEARRLHRL